jgi:hypothetical protein
VDWEAKLAWAEAEHERRRASAVARDEREDFRLAGIAGASWAAGLASLMLGRTGEARAWLRRAADEYDTSWRAAPPGSWGRPIAVIRCRLMARDRTGAQADATAAVDAGVLDASGPIAGYCAALALLVLGRDGEAESVSARIVDEGLEPAAVAEALGALARADGPGYADARLDVLRSFERREAFLEDIRVADTVIVLDALASARGLDPAPLSSPLLPA